RIRSHRPSFAPDRNSHWHPCYANGFFVSGQYTAVTVLGNGILWLLSYVRRRGFSYPAPPNATMLQGDPDWWRLAATIKEDDHGAALEHNAQAEPEYRLYQSLGPVPCVGAIKTAPVVLLLSHPTLDGQSTPNDYSF